MKRPTRRTIIKFLTLLIAGATLNVAVAWGCALWLERTPSGLWGPSEPEHRWADDVGLRRDLLHSVLTRHNLAVREEFLCRFPSVRESSRGTNEPVAVALKMSSGTPLPAFTAEYRAVGDDLLDPLWSWTSSVGFAIRYQRDWRFLPFAPLWPGFAINTLFYAGVLWMLFCGPFALRRMIRRRRGQCPACAYPIGQSPVCTECGAAVTLSTGRTGTGAIS